MTARNNRGTHLVPFSHNPLTGCFREGCCHAHAQDAGSQFSGAGIITRALLDFCGLPQCEMSRRKRGD